MATTNRAVFLLLFSLVVSALVVWAGVRWVNGQVEARSASNNIRLVVAAAPIPAGARITPVTLKVVDWPKSNPVEGGYTDPGPLLNRVAIVNLSPGEPILEPKLAPQGSRAGLSALIPDGMRAVTIRVNDVTDVAGFALPGNYVDVIVTFQDDRSHMISKIVLQKILVLAVAQEATVKDDSKAKLVNAVTLQVTPAQAEKLDLARGVGNLSLVLRNQLDKSAVETEGARKMELLGTPPPKKTSGRKAPEDTVEVIRGTQMTIYRNPVSNP